VVFHQVFGYSVRDLVASAELAEGTLERKPFTYRARLPYEVLVLPLDLIQLLEHSKLLVGLFEGCSGGNAKTE